MCPSSAQITNLTAPHLTSPHRSTTKPNRPLNYLTPHTLPTRNSKNPHPSAINRLQCRTRSPPPPAATRTKLNAKDNPKPQHSATGPRREANNESRTRSIRRGAWRAGTRRRAGKAGRGRRRGIGCMRSGWRTSMRSRRGAPRFGGGCPGKRRADSFLSVKGR